MSSSTSFGSGTFGSGALGSAPFFNTKDLIDSVLTTTGHASPAQETRKRAAILQFLNNTYQEVVMARHWRWLYATYDFSIFGPNSTGTVSATNNDQTITGTGTAFDSTDLKGKLVIDNVQSVYNVSSVASTTSLELDTKWAGDSVSDSSFKIYKAQYKLAAEVDQILNMTNDAIGLKMIPLGYQELRRLQQQDPTSSGAPRYYSLIRRETDDDSQYIEVFPYPDKDYNIHIDYTVRILKLEDSEDVYPIVPDRYRVVLFYGALAQFYRYLNDPQGEANAKQDFGRVFVRLQNDTQLTDPKVIIKPARNYRNRALRYARSTKGFQNRDTFGRDS